MTTTSDRTDRDLSTASPGDPDPGPDGRMAVPTPRGPMSEALLSLLKDEVSDPTVLHHQVAAAVVDPPQSWFAADDAQVTLLCLYELSYRGLAGVDDEWEWSADLVVARRMLERCLEAELRRRVHVPEPAGPGRADVADQLFGLADADDSPSVARWVSRNADLTQVRELLVLKSVYQLKEADPHTWAIPRLSGAAKAALVEIQADEYGAGDPSRMHAALFAGAMRAAGLDDTYGRYVDLVPAPTLAAVNLMSLFGLNRRLRGHVVGHLAAYEITSSLPSRLTANGIRRVGLGPEASAYFDEHVEADAVHEQIAARDMAGALVEAEPHLARDVLAGAAACLGVEGWAAAHVLERWRSGRSALLRPVDLGA